MGENHPTGTTEEIDHAALRRLGDEIWDGHHPHRLLGIFPLGHRMTVIRQPDGGLILHSPIPLTNSLAAELERLGPVRHVLAPNLYHNLFLGPWAKENPDARFWVVPGFSDKCPRLRADAILDTDVDIPGLRCERIQGMPKVNECVILHEASRSVIVADLVFNFPHTESLALRWLLKMVGAHGGVAVSKLYRSRIVDQDALRSSLERVLSWDFDRVIVGHGDNITTGGKQALRTAYAWLLDRAP